MPSTTISSANATVMVFLFLALVAIVVKTLAKVARDKEQGDATTVDPRSSVPETPECAGCSAPNPRHPAPCLVAVRSLFDGSWWDDLLLRVGLRREVRHAVSLVRDIDVPASLCPECHGVARSICERKVAEMISGRALSAQSEATDVARFSAFAMHDVLRGEVKDQRDRRVKEQRAAMGARNGASNGNGAYAPMSNGGGAAS